MTENRNLTRNIFLALILGTACGIWLPQIAPYVRWMGQAFKLSLAMLVAPLIFASILSGMGQLGDVRSLGNLGGRTFFYFLLTTFMAIGIGLFLVAVIQPGVSENSQELVKLLNGKATVSQSTMTFGEFAQAQLSKMFVNPFKAMAEQEVLAIIFFAILLGCALNMIGSKGKLIFDIAGAFTEAMMKIIGFVMRFAPYGVFGLIIDVVASAGIEVFRSLGMYALCVLLGLALQMFVVYPVLLKTLTNISPFQFFKAIRPALAVAFSTSSSNATLPVSFKCAEEGLGINPKVTRFALPLGATMNLNGTALYESVAAVFIAQLFGMGLTFSSQVIIALTAATAAMGAAGIPAAGTVTLALVLSAVGLPLEGIGLLLALDRPLDMCRTAVNVCGDIAVTAILGSGSNKEVEIILPA